MDWHIINSLLALLCAVIALALAVFAYRRQDVTGAGSFGFLALTIAIMCAAYAFELSTTELELFLFGAKLEYIGGVSLPVAWLIFALTFSGYERWLTPRAVLGLAIIPIITLILVWTNERHGLIWATPRLRFAENYPIFEPVYGGWFWVSYSYSVILFLLGTAFLLRMARRTWDVYRQQSIMLIIGAIIPWIGNVMTIFDIYLIPRLHPTPLSFTLSTITLAWALFQYRLLVVMPLAYDVILDNVPDGVVVLDNQQRILSLNKALLPYLDQPNQDVIGQPLPQAFARVMPLVQEFWQQPETQREIQVDNLDVDMRIVPLIKRGKQRGRLFILQNITRQKQAERELKNQYAELQRLYKEVTRLEKLKTDMLRIAAHDLRNPLSITGGYLQLIEADAPLTPTQTHFMREAEKSIQRMEQIIRDFLTLERMQMADSDSFIRFDFAHQVREAYEEFQPRTEVKGQTFTLQIIPDERYYILGDPPQIHEALINLISNAIKYTPEKGQIDVRLYITGNMLNFEVTDTGIGIPENLQEPLFQPFYRARTVETISIDGTGLGLYLVKGVVERHHGEMIFRSVHGQGSTFGFRLPIMSAPSE